MMDRQAWAEDLSDKARRKTTICVCSGSRVEGLNLPLLIQTQDDVHVTDIRQSDVDLMVVRPDVLAVNEARPIETHLVMETSEVHPGYVQLRSPITNQLEDRALLGTLPHEEIETQGPAKVHRSGIGESDAVRCIGSVWPNFATEWVTRERFSGWPSPELVKKVVSGGCHVVPVAHHLSSQPEVEWRFSFSKSEEALAETLSEVQKQCYLFLKILHVAELKDPRMLATYHLKNVLLWACEKIPQDQWTKDTLGERFLYLLDQLLYCLTRHNIPHYFLPNNNLIDHIPKETVATLVQKVSCIRKDPLKYLVKFKQNYKFMSGPFSADFQEILKPLTNTAMPTEDSEKDMLGVFSEVGFQVATAYIRDLPLVCRLAKDKALTDAFEDLQPGNLRNYVQRLLKPFMCVTEIFNLIETFSMNEESQIDFLKSLKDTITKLCRDMHDMKGTIYNSADACVEALKCVELGRPTSPVTDLAKSLCVALRSNDVCLHLGMVKGKGRDVPRQTVESVFYVLYASFIILNQHPDANTVNEELQRFLKVRKCLQGLGWPEYIIACTDMLLGHVYLKKGQAEEASHMLEKLGIPQELMTTWCGWYSLDQVQSWYTTLYGNPKEVDQICYGRIFTLQQVAPFLRIYIEPGLLCYGIFRPLPVDNLFKPAYHKLTEAAMKASIKDKEEGSQAEAQAKADYSCFLIHVSHFKEASDQLQELMSSPNYLRDGRCTYSGPTIVAVHMGVLMRGAEDSVEKKVEFYTKPYAYFLLVQCHLKQGRIKDAEDALSCMEETCDDIKCNSNEPHWEVLANNYSLLGFAYELCGNHHRSILAHCLVTRIQYDHQTGDTCSTRMKPLFTESHIKTVSIESIIGRYLEFLFPSHSSQEALCLLMGTLCPVPAPPWDTNAKVSILLQMFETFLKAVYPDVPPTVSIGSFLKPLGPVLEETVINFFSDFLQEPPKVWIRVLLLVLYQPADDSVPNLPMWLEGYLATFYETTPPRHALSDFFTRIYPDIPTEEAILEFFAIAGITTSEMSKTFGRLHSDLNEALLITVFLKRDSDDPVTPYLRAAFPDRPLPEALFGILQYWSPGRTPLEGLVSFVLTAYPGKNTVEGMTALMKILYPNASLPEAKQALLSHLI